MAKLEIHVPAERVGVLRGALIDHYCYVANEVEGPRNLPAITDEEYDRILPDREKLATVDEAIGQLGWRGPVPEDGVDLTIDRAIFDYVVQFHLESAGDEVRCTATADDRTKMDAALERLSAWADLRGLGEINATAEVA